MFVQYSISKGFETMSFVVVLQMILPRTQRIKPSKPTDQMTISMASISEENSPPWNTGNANARVNRNQNNKARHRTIRHKPAHSSLPGTLGVDLRCRQVFSRRRVGVVYKPLIALLAHDRVPQRWAFRAFIASPVQTTMPVRKPMPQKSNKQIKSNDSRLSHWIKE